MYPPLCFSGSVKGYAAEESEDTLKASLGEENYELVTNATNGTLPVQFKFKLLELLDSFCR